jgi:hypothetical protein
MHGRRQTIVLLLCLLIGTTASLPQNHALPPPVGGITFQQVIRLSQSGLSDDTIIAQIKRRPQPFNLSPPDLLQLKSAHVSDAVIEAMEGAKDPLKAATQASVATRNVTAAQSAPVITTAQERPSSQPASVMPAVAAPQAIAQTAAQIASQGPTPMGVQPSKVNEGKIRVYVTDRPITEVISMIRGGSEGTASASGSASGNQSGFTANYSASAQQSSYVAGIKNDNRGGADPRTLEVSGDILENCHISNLVVTSNPAVADYVMDFRRQGGKRSTFFLFGGLSGLAISSAI